MKTALFVAAVLLGACTSVEQESRRQHVDSAIRLSDALAFKTAVTVDEILVGMGVCQPGDDWEDKLGEVRFSGTESAVNSYALRGGGGVFFTTAYSGTEAIWSERTLRGIVTSYEFNHNERSYFFTLQGGRYVRTR